MKPILVHHQQGSTMCPGGLGWLVHSVALWDPWGLGQAALEDGSLDGRGWLPTLLSLGEGKKVGFVKPGYTAQILPQRHLGQAVSFSQVKGGKGDDCSRK